MYQILMGSLPWGLGRGNSNSPFLRKNLIFMGNGLFSWKFWKAKDQGGYFVAVLHHNDTDAEIQKAENDSSISGMCLPFVLFYTDQFD